MIDEDSHIYVYVHTCSHTHKTVQRGLCILSVNIYVYTEHIDIYVYVDLMWLLTLLYVYIKGSFEYVYVKGLLTH